MELTILLICLIAMLILTMKDIYDIKCIKTVIINHTGILTKQIEDIKDFNKKLNENIKETKAGTLDIKTFNEDLVKVNNYLDAIALSIEQFNKTYSNSQSKLSEEFEKQTDFFDEWINGPKEQEQEQKQEQNK